MTKRIGWTAVMVCAMALAGCGESPKPAAKPAKPPTEDVSPKGNHTDILGTVTKIDKDGDLVTDIPADWITLQGRTFLRMTIAGKDYPALLACPDPEYTLRECEWAVYWGSDETLNIRFRDGSAAKAAGASVGTRVRLVKVDEPTAAGEKSPKGTKRDILGTVTKIDKDGNLVTDIPVDWTLVQWRVYLRMTIAGVDYAALWYCPAPGPTLRQCRWAVYYGSDDTLKICVRDGNAAKITGATVGTRVRLVKMVNPPANEGDTVGTVMEVDKDGNLVTDINMDCIDLISYGKYVKMTIEGKDYPVLADAIHPDAVKQGEWIAWAPGINSEPAGGPEMRIDLKDGNAAKTTGAGVGTRVRFTKVDKPAAAGEKSPKGTGGDIVGTVTKVDKDGNLVTDIPTKWIITQGRTYLKMTIAGVDYPALFFCGSPEIALRECDWVVWFTEDHTFQIYFKGGNAAKAAGASVGTRVRLVKVGKPH